MSFLVKRATSVVRNHCQLCRMFSATNEVSALALAKQRCPRCNANVQASHAASTESNVARKSEANNNYSTVNFNTIALGDLSRITSIQQDSFNLQTDLIQPESFYPDVSSHFKSKSAERTPQLIKRTNDNTVSSANDSKSVGVIEKGGLPAKQTQFYGRELPRSCTAFASSEGKRIFAEALQLGYMEAFFTLGPQLTTQDEPAFCGLASLVVALNALRVDPGRVWKGPWRWYHETMLDCCVPLGRVVRNGITLSEFASIAECNAVQARTRLADESLSLDEFRSVIRDCTSRNDKVLVCAYSRSRVQQTGDGHFAPIGGYHPERDLVLVLDTARFKYPPHWLSVPLLLDAMRAPDRDAGGRPRGFCVIQNPTDLPSLQSSQENGRIVNSASMKSRCSARQRPVQKCSSCGYSDID